MFLGKLKRSDIQCVSFAAKMIERRLFYGNPYFLSNAELSLLTGEWAKDLAQENFDLIIGIPRSGLLVASMISLKLGLPLSTPDEFLKGTIWLSEQMETKKINKILLVDDTVCSGGAMKNEVKKLKNYNIVRGALLATDKGKHEVDLYYKEMPGPIYGEWNLIHQKIGLVGFDMDGVLCEECPVENDDDGEKYLEFLKTARRLYIPTYEIDVIITSRFEKYRKETEAWLEQNGVKYKKLVMWNIEHKENRRQDTSAKYKAGEILKNDIDYYVESSDVEARYMWDRTLIPIICVESMKMYHESLFKNHRKAKKGLNEDLIYK